jgi:hypothetical protein
VLHFIYYYAECHFAECCVLFIIMLNVIMLSVVMLSVIILNVVAPFIQADLEGVATKKKDDSAQFELP